MDSGVGGGSARFVAGTCIENLAGLDRAFVLDVIVKDDLVDACIDNRRTMLQQQLTQGDRLFFFANQGDVDFEDISIRPLVS
jgi:beta-fructofuranosidase